MKYLVISDIHGNLDAFEAVLNNVGSFDKIIFLGDIVDYGAQPNECIELMKRQKAICLVGNHDLVQMGELTIRHMHGEAMQCGYWTKNTLTKKSIDWLKLHKTIKEKEEFTLVHGSPFDPALDYIDSTGKADRIFKTFKFPLLLHGHSHVPVLFVENEGYAYGPETEDSYIDTKQKRCIINPGSVGQPRDGNENAAYGLLEDGVFTWKRVEYDIPGAQRKIKGAGLPESQAERLMYGR